MLKKRTLFILSAAIIGCSAFSMAAYKLIVSVKTPGVAQLTVDNLGNAYTVSKDGVFVKYNATLDTPPLTFTDKSLGKLACADVSNPLKLLLLYPDYAQIDVLDSKLSPTGTISLRDLGVIQPTLLCNSYNNCMWVYDQQDFQLKRIDPNLQVTNQSGSIAQITGHDVYPVFLTSYNNWLFMVDTVVGIMQFDMYGTYYKTIPVKNVSSLQVIDDMLLYLEHGKDSALLYSYNIKKRPTAANSNAIQ